METAKKHAEKIMILAAVQLIVILVEILCPDKFGIMAVAGALCGGIVGMAIRIIGLGRKQDS